MTLKQQIEADFIEAYKSKNETLVSVLRMLKSAIKNYEINSKAEASDDEIIKILRKENKQRQEAIAEFEKASRNDLAEKEKAEVTIISKYLPAEIDEEQLKVIAKAVIAEQGFVGMKDMGKAIGAVMQKAGASADGSKVSQVVKSILLQS